MKSSVSFVCQQCGYISSSWLGKCSECGAWNSLVETLVSKKSSSYQRLGSTLTNDQSSPISFDQIEQEELVRMSTGLGEFDRSLGGGIVPGSVVLLGGDPGIGKSTILLQVALKLSERNLTTIIVAGEESPGQIKIRVERVGKHTDNIRVLPQTDIDLVIDTLSHTKPNLVIIDSIQTMFTSDLDGSSGSVGQVRECAWRLVRYAKSSKVPVFLVGHVTKEGTIAGPRVLEHLVDTVLYMEGERYHTFRLVRSIKNRFGKSDEIGIFEMTGEGMKEVANPSLQFLNPDGPQVGSVVVSTMEGSRPILAEIQALTATTIFGMPKRSANGIDLNRLQMLSAVLSRRAGIQLGNQDIYVNVAGGLKISEPAVDLGVCLAIASNTLDKSLTEQTVVIGEVGLQGEVRDVPGLEKRMSEAKKIGFKNFITSSQVKSVREAIKFLK
ncbi:MAG: DNA repair protein RadA [Candidatus Woykebacteria bacterium RIFCSPLOWO2_01_FULL_43_14]|uniref:DNA repair protein RadA n=2 Tax=Candidatus Woykeibacteriota TaxID=1817899 RepID=A0A1G1WV04_9BACT|nr:MAG: DNA repair protein RadA [Candidatus Woykebacteria bacterium RIFCSPHIGHO2_02_FULL_43_16b]OGY31545.1 MAG: DNA repair protein RadA [Candidatus Woykebacteria bacterium RIFCSPLOWO2_01_FULL_43_14]